MKPVHLAVVRAALTFWDEEMATASRPVYRHYLHSRDQEVVIAPADVAAARVFFNEVVIKFGLLDLQSGTLIATPLVEDIDELICNHDQKIVSVLT